MVSITEIVVLGATLGFLATLVMDLPMRRLPEGMTAPYVAASVLTGVRPGDVTERRAKAVHYAAGLTSGMLFLTLVAVVSAVVGTTANVLSVRGILAAIAAGGIVFGWLIGFFSLIVLPRYGRGFAGQRLRKIRADWRVAAMTHAGTLVALWVLLLLLF